MGVRGEAVGRAQLVPLAVPGPRWVRGGLTPHTHTGPLTLTNSIWTRPLERHCRPIHSHAGTLSYHDVKIKGWREREKKDFQCLLLGTPHTGGAVWHEGEQHGGCGYRMGTSTEVMYKGGGAPTQPPIGLNWLMGVDACKGSRPLGVSPPDPLLRGPWGARGWE